MVNILWDIFCAAYICIIILLDYSLYYITDTDLCCTLNIDPNDSFLIWLFYCPFIGGGYKFPIYPR
jgi:hypothetical protein